MSITCPINCVNTGRSRTGWETSAAVAHIRLHPIAPKMPTNRTMRPVRIPCGNRNDSAEMARDAEIHAIQAKGPDRENQAAMPVPKPTGIHKGILSRSLSSQYSSFFIKAVADMFAPPQVEVCRGSKAMLGAAPGLLRSEEHTS